MPKFHRENREVPVPKSLYLSVIKTQGKKSFLRAAGRGNIPSCLQRLKVFPEIRTSLTRETQRCPVRKLLREVERSPPGLSCLARTSMKRFGQPFGVTIRLRSRKSCGFAATLLDRAAIGGAYKV